MDEGFRGVAASAPRKTPPATAASDAGYVPPTSAREVWKRDQARCQWAMPDGTVCGAARRLELDHVVPKAQGGPSTVANLRVLCSPHNDEAARLAFGDEWMDWFTRRDRLRS